MEKTFGVYDVFPCSSSESNTKQSIVGQGQQNLNRPSTLPAATATDCDEGFMNKVPKKKVRKMISF